MIAAFATLVDDAPGDPAFAALALGLPAEELIGQQMAEIDVRVAASMSLADFHSDGVDLAIRYGAGRYPDLHVERLLDEAVFPVCSPALLKGAVPLDKPELARIQNALARLTKKP
jgi:LysR family glycine cleavage system transcriptional activator